METYYVSATFNKQLLSLAFLLGPKIALYAGKEKNHLP